MKLVNIQQLRYENEALRKERHEGFLVRDELRSIIQEQKQRIKELENGLISIRNRLYPNSLGEYDWVEAQDLITRLLDGEQN